MTVTISLFIVSNLLFVLVSGSVAPQEVPTEVEAESTRDGKLFPFVAVVKMGEESCGGTSNGVTTLGVCRTPKQCDDQNGIAGGSCGGGYGVCCTFVLTCPASTTSNNVVSVTASGTHIVSSSSMNAAASCQINFRRPNADICQMRLDFVNFNIAGPNANGDCDRGSLTVSADNLQNFITCGQNTGQHLYLDYGLSDTVTVNINPNTDNMPAPVFDLMATFIRCRNSTSSGKRKGKKFGSGGGGKNKNKGGSSDNGSPMQDDPAPVGCDQYYTATSGIVRSFNYVSTGDQVQNQINTEMYMVCVKTPPGSRKINWQPCPGEENPFSITGMAMNPNMSKTGSDCPTDYIDIPGSPAGRYCGTGFPSVVMSSAKPFFMYVYFDGQEVPAINNMIDPVIGCPVGMDCCSQFGDIIIPQGPNSPGDVLPCNSDEAVAAGEYCRLAQGLWPLVDDSNIGFCLKYTIM